MEETTTDQVCARCGELLNPDEPVWVERASGVLRITPLRDFDEPLPPVRAWHSRCLDV